MYATHSFKWSWYIFLWLPLSYYVADVTLFHYCFFFISPWAEILSGTTSLGGKFSFRMCSTFIRVFLSLSSLLLVPWTLYGTDKPVTRPIFLFWSSSGKVYKFLTRTFFFYRRHKQRSLDGVSRQSCWAHFNID